MAIRIRPKDGERHLEQDAALAVKLASTRPWIVSGLALGNGTGLNAEIGAGLAWIAGYVVELDAAEPASCAASQTNHIFLELAIDGNDLVTGLNVVVNTTDTPPSGPFVKLGTATTDGSSVTGTATTGRSPEAQVEPIPQAAEDISYDNGTSGLAATDVQAAVDELAARPASGGWTGVACKTATQNFSNQTRATITGLPIALEANSQYIFRATYLFTGANTAGIRLGFTVPAGSTGSFNTFYAMGYQVNSVRTPYWVIGSGYNANVDNPLVFDRDGILVTVMGIVNTSGTAGNLTPQAARAIASGTLTINIGSVIEIKKVS